MFNKIFPPIFIFAASLMIATGAGAQIASTTASSTPFIASSAPAVLEIVDRTEVFLLDKTIAANEYLAVFFDNKFKVRVSRESLSSNVSVKAEIISEKIPLPWRLDKISDIFQYDFLNKDSYNGAKLLKIDIPYSTSTPFYKRVFYYNKNSGRWLELPAVDYPEEKIIRVSSPFTFARLAVFSDPDVLISGRASWYKYKNGLFAASPDFPKGSKIRVYNLKNNKHVDVTINDFGPDRRLHPDRVIDLDKLAFQKISALGAGIIKTRIEILKIATTSADNILRVPKDGFSDSPSVNSKALALIDDGGNLLWEKNASASLPIASLSKMVALRVFLDQKPDFNKTVVYKKQDENFNYEYCKPEESARLKVKDGETMKVSDLFYSALIGSANNAVESLVRVSGLSRKEFISEMNKMAASYGALDTYFAEPTGLAKENRSSAKDYALLSREILRHPIIQKISTTQKYQFKTINTKKPHTIYNSNTLIRNNYFIREKDFKISGSKTGYLDEAGYCLFMQAENNSGRRVTGVILGAASKQQSLLEVEDLLRYGLRKMK